MTHARHLIQGASFDPVTLPILAAIFKEVWSSIAALYGEDPQTMEKARLKLATVVLDLARDGQLGPLQITRTAARLMREASETQRRYPRGGVSALKSRL
jgi:hypothetical protein